MNPTAKKSLVLHYTLLVEDGKEPNSAVHS